MKGLIVSEMNPLAVVAVGAAALAIGPSLLVTFPITSTVAALGVWVWATK